MLKNLIGEICFFHTILNLNGYIYCTLKILVPVLLEKQRILALLVCASVPRTHLNHERILIVCTPTYEYLSVY